MAMRSTKIDVDIESLYSLKGAISRASKDLVNIRESISLYLLNTSKMMQNTIDIFQKNLSVAQIEVDKAKMNLHSALNAYNSSLNYEREREDEDEDRMPSFSFGKARVALCSNALRKAEGIRDAWKRKVEAAERIKRDCEQEIGKYYDTGGFFHPAGGDSLITSLAEDHFNMAVSKLAETINAVEQIQSYSFATGESGPSSIPDIMYEMPYTGFTEEVYDAKREQFEEGKRRVEDMIDKRESEKKLPSSFFEICPHCKKFKKLNCICGRDQNQRER